MLGRPHGATLEQLQREPHGLFEEAGAAALPDVEHRAEDGLVPEALPQRTAGNVDPPLARRLLRLFMELNRTGTAVVIATHDLDLMEQVAARRLVLSDGRLDIYD